MSKYVNIPTGNYKLSVQRGGEIKLDTGPEIGRVVITGDLIVEGDTTTVHSEEMTVRDNIIVVNSGETGAGVSLVEAGIQVNRGTKPNTYITFNETIEWADPITQTTKLGGFVFKDQTNSLIGIKTNSIVAGDNDLYITCNSGVIKVINPNYTGLITDNNHIPNKEYVDFAVSQAIGNINSIQDGTSSESSVAVWDIETTGEDSRISFTIDNVLISSATSSRWEFTSIAIENNSIISDNTPLILKSTNTNSVQVDDSLSINSLVDLDDPNSIPLPPAQGIKLYTSADNSKNNGLYYINANNIRDELISKNRAIIYSLIF